ncbi:MAG: 2-hydroxyacid dehydrogenase [Verrucomicrobia bacterium]|nr:2-hydroxyacid dehydrogenase [Verrucomicrobiota bacterium]MCH8512561.1 2-hydroxyacid dehydrogenase [Kiritimatiellia bacterium]
MKTIVFSAESYERPFFERINAAYGHDLGFIEAQLNADTVSLAKGIDCVCAFVNDRLNAEILEKLSEGGTRLIALRSAGFNHVDLEAAERLGLQVVRVPAYSPHAVAEHAICLMMSLNRKVHRAYNRVREGNFQLHGLMGFDVHGKTVGIVGTGKIGECAATILKGFGCRLLGFDPYVNPACQALGMEYVDLKTLFAESDIISLHCPLTPDTKHLIDAEAIATMKDGVQILNTSRGAVVDTAAVIEALKKGKIGSVGLDVYEEEGDFFFRNLSNTVLQDDQLARLLTFPNVIITGHQAFFTEEALHGIVDTTLANIQKVERDGKSGNEVSIQKHVVG